MRLNLEAEEEKKSLDICLEESVGEQRIEGSGHWTDKEHQRFLDALELYGKNWKLIQQHIGSRSVTQTRSHAQKYFNKLKQIKGADKGEGKQRLLTYRSKRESKEIIVEKKPRKERTKKTMKKLQYANNLNLEHERKHYFDKVEELMNENNTNKNYELFLEENKCTPLVHDPLDFSFANIPRTPPLMYSEYEGDLCVQMPWDNEIEASNLYRHLSEPLLLEDAVQTIVRREELYTDIIPVCKVEQDFNMLFEF